MLSKKFIESTGWTQYSNPTERTVGYKHEDYRLFYNKQTNRLRIGKIDEDEIIGYKEYFDGVIDNEKDYIRLLRQISIDVK